MNDAYEFGLINRFCDAFRALGFDALVIGTVPDFPGAVSFPWRKGHLLLTVERNDEDPAVRFRYIVPDALEAYTPGQGLIEEVSAEATLMMARTYKRVDWPFKRIWSDIHQTFERLERRLGPQ